MIYIIFIFGHIFIFVTMATNDVILLTSGPKFFWHLCFFSICYERNQNHLTVCL